MKNYSLSYTFNYILKKRFEKSGLIFLCLLLSALGGMAQASILDKGLNHRRSSLQQGRLYKMSFSETWSRYPAPDVILNIFRDRFSVGSFATLSTECNQLSENNRAQLGESMPISGLPAIDNPNSTFVNWYLKCLVEYIGADDGNLAVVEDIPKADGTYESKISDRDIVDIENLFGPEVIQECKAKDDELGSLSDPSKKVSLIKFSCRWQKLSTEIRVKYIRGLIEKYIGPEDVLIDLEIADSETAYVQMLFEELDNFMQKPDRRYEFLKVNPNEGNLTLRDASKILKFLINLDDNLKF